MVRSVMFWIISLVFALASAGSGLRSGDSSRLVVGQRSDTVVVRASVNVALSTLLEEWAIGSVDGPVHTRFGEITDAAITPAGNVIIADAISHTVQEFDEQRRLVRTFGARGRGPGEYEFGLPNAIAVIRGANTRTKTTYESPYGFRNYAAHTDECDGLKGQMCVRRTRGQCTAGFDARESRVMPREESMLPGARESVPGARHPHRDYYPEEVFYRYKWSEFNAFGCARTYNTLAQFQFTPLWRDAASPFSMTTDSWQLGVGSKLIGGPPHREQYSPAYGPVGVVNNFQLARLPRGDSMLVFAAVEDDGDALSPQKDRGGRGQWITALLAAITVPPRDAMLTSRVVSEAFSQRSTLSLMAPTSPLFVGIEILTPDTIGFARARTGLPISPWLEGHTRLSDIVLFRPRNATGAEIAIDSVFSSAATSHEFARGDVLGLYWETQVASLPDSVNEVQVELSIERVNKPAGFLARLFSGLFGGSGGPRSARWSFPISPVRHGDFLRWGNSINIPTENLSQGDYELSLQVSGITSTSAVSKRALRIVK